MANNYYEATGVLVLDRVTPVIQALFGAFALDESHPGNGQAYIAQIAETTRKVTALIDDIVKNAPPGSENAVAILKTAIANANAAYEQLKNTTRQASDTMGANVTNVVNQFSQAAEKATGRTK